MSGTRDLWILDNEPVLQDRHLNLLLDAIMAILKGES